MSIQYISYSLNFSIYSILTGSVCTVCVAAVLCVLVEFCLGSDWQNEMAHTIQTAHMQLIMLCR